jgi:hypothetical protein
MTGYKIRRTISRIDCEALQAYLLEGFLVGEIFPSYAPGGCMQLVYSMCRQWKPRKTSTHNLDNAGLNAYVV